MSDSVVSPVDQYTCTMQGHQALCCPIHSKNKKKNALFNYKQRQQKARKWHQDQGASPDLALDRANATDCNRPVGVKSFKPGKKLEQWVRVKDRNGLPGKPGCDFTEPGTNPKTLGIKIDPKTGLPKDRVLKQAVVEKPLKGLRSWAGDVKDVPGKLVGGKGGGPQMSMQKGWEESIRFID
jgi:hypothetical protein